MAETYLLTASRTDAAQATKDAEDTTGTPHLTETRDYRLFLVEDHPKMRQLLRRMLEEEPGITVAGEAGSAEAALEQLPALAPDMLLVDLSLPGMSGVGLVKSLRECRPELRCLVVTGHTDPIYRAAAESAGAVGYVTKDDPNDILAAVWTVLGSKGS